MRSQEAQYVDGLRRIKNNATPESVLLKRGLKKVYGMSVRCADIDTLQQHVLCLQTPGPCSQQMALYSRWESH